ncbi:ubiquinone/menaquinone biosynthesis C-methylase UbiE [Amorphus suaedae]
MSIYQRLIGARMVSAGCGLPILAKKRQRIIPKARGVVVEIGIGAGYNLPFYDRDKVERLIGVNPADGFCHADRIAARADGLPVDIVEESAEALSLPTGIADTVVFTYTLCSIGDVKAALAEARRILKPDGHVLFCEHGRSTRASTGRLQERLTPIWRPIACGCRLDRNPVGLLERAGFEIDCVEQGSLHGVPDVLGFHHVGIASPRVGQAVFPSAV